MEGEEHFGIGRICEILKQSGYSPHSILLLNNFASIGAIVLLASFRNLVDMPSIPLDEVFLRLFTQAVTSSAQVPYRCMGRKIEVEKTASHKYLIFAKQLVRPHQSGAHGTSHTCHTLDTPLPI